MLQTKKIKPRSGLNLLLSLHIAVSALFLLWWASHGDTPQIIVAALLFSIILQPNYVLLHEGSHDNHHYKPLLNRLMSNVNGLFFPISATFYRLTHGFHHENNRSEHECFEYYDPQQTLGDQIFRHLQWVSIVFGTYWLLILMANLTAAIVPWLLKLWPFSAMITTRNMFDRFDSQSLRWISLETAVIILFWLFIWSALELQWLPTLVLYAAFAFNWSSRQYIAHAFSPIDKDRGAYNLKLNRFSQLFLLNSNYHLTHHQYPDIPWHLLPEYARSEPTHNYWQQYRLLWTAPRVFPDSQLIEQRK